MIIGFKEGYGFIPGPSETAVPEMEKVRIITFHVLDKNLEKVIGHITAAVMKKMDGKFKMACSFCNPKDQLDKKFGQFIACRRPLFSPPDRGSVITFQRIEGEPVVKFIKQGCLVLAAHYPVRWVLQQVDSINQLK